MTFRSDTPQTGCLPDCGVIYVIKPAGMPSGGVVGKIKYLLHTKRVGHAGTLDPGAAGVLPVCYGRATRLSQYLTDSTKRYVAEICFGAATDTLDAYGAVVKREQCAVSKDELLSVIPAFIGEIEQTAPAYSAVKIGGRPSYVLARKGIEVTKPPRKVRIDSVELLHRTGEKSFLLDITCGSGTYIRTLLFDIGVKLGVPAYTSFLLRARAGGRDISEAYTLEEIEAKMQNGDFSFIISAEDATGKLPALILPPQRTFALKNGLPTDTGAAPGEYRIYCEDRFYGLGRADGAQVRLMVNLVTL